MRYAVVALTMTAFALTACEGGGRRGGPPGGGGFMMGPGGGGFGIARATQLARFDADADGAITRDEFNKVLKADLAVCDKDGNGELSAGETRFCNEKLLGGDRTTSPIIDWNADGRVTLDEFSAQWRTLFSKADDDHDDVISAAELARPTTGSGPPGGPPGGGPPGGRRPPGGGPPGGGPPGGGGGF